VPQIRGRPSIPEAPLRECTIRTGRLGLLAQTSRCAGAEGSPATYPRSRQIQGVAVGRQSTRISSLYYAEHAGTLPLSSPAKSGSLPSRAYRALVQRREGPRQAIAVTSTGR